METSNNIADKKRFVQKRMGETFQGVNLHVKTYLDVLSPLKIIKRVLFRPYLGRWYPYIDVYSPGYETQLSFFYGKIRLDVSKEKLCCHCHKYLTSNFDFLANSLNIPVSLCNDCSSMIFYDYWDCLGKLIKDAFTHNQDDKEKESISKTLLCEDLLNPKCGYPITFEKINPCLKNHAIGVLILNHNKLEIIIGTLEAIRYQMIRKGGIYGLIFGYSNRVLNLERLRQILRDFIKQIKLIIEDYNQLVQKNNLNEEWKNIKISNLELINPFKGTKNLFELDKTIISEWFILNFLSYYTNFSSKKLMHMILTPSINILEYLVKNLYKKVELDIEILDIVELNKMFPPLNFELRDYYENLFKKWLGKNNFRDVIRNLSKNCENVIRCIIPSISDEMNSVNFEKINSTLKIHEIMCILGSYVILKSNHSNNYSCVNLNELIGHRIQ